MKILRRGAEMVVMTPEIREFMREPTVLIVIKANVNSRVHRRVRMDYVGVKPIRRRPDRGRAAPRRPVHLGGLYPLGAPDPLCPPQGGAGPKRAGFDPESHSGKALRISSRNIRGTSSSRSMPKRSIISSWKS